MTLQVGWEKRIVIHILNSRLCWCNLLQPCFTCAYYQASCNMLADSDHNQQKLCANIAIRQWLPKKSQQTRFNMLTSNSMRTITIKITKVRGSAPQLEESSHGGSMFSCKKIRDSFLSFKIVDFSYWSTYWSPNSPSHHAHTLSRLSC